MKPGELQRELQRELWKSIVADSGAIIACVTGILNKAKLFLLLFILWAPATVTVEAGYLLEPMDLSSPRSTLNSFMEEGDASYQKVETLYRGVPSRDIVDGNIEHAKKILRAFDMGDIPPAASFDVGHDGLVYLYDVLSRIELPSDAARLKAAEKQGRNGCCVQELLFPSFSFDYRRKHRNTLDYPPEGK